MMLTENQTELLKVLKTDLLPTEKLQTILLKFAVSRKVAKKLLHPSVLQELKIKGGNHD